MTWDKPIKADPFVAFDIFDRTAPADNNQTYGVAWKHDGGFKMFENDTNKTSFYLQDPAPHMSTESSIDAYTKVQVMVSSVVIFVF